jgi:ethanolamine utilization protein EutN
MNLARIIGTVWATKKHPSLEGFSLKVIQPLTSEMKHIGSPIVATDSVGTGQPDELVYYVTSGEAPIPLDRKMPTDATIIGIAERIDR